MAEAILNRVGRGRFAARSAGVERFETADPAAIKALENARYATEELWPKTIADLTSVPLDFVFTLSDTARDEPKPDWQGQPISAHWACEDPVDKAADEVARALRYGQVLAGLERRISIFVELPFDSLDRRSLQHRVDEISDLDADA